MQLTKKLEKDILKIYETWLHSYLNGDVKTYNHYFDDEYHFIGSTNNEEFLNRKDTTKFFKKTAEQLSEKTELRNETKTIEQFGDLIFITHVFDAWFLNGKEWRYYSRFRFSNVLRKNEDGWRFIYQHYSVPDGKTQKDETIGYDKINEENQELREAIQRRTKELEYKNRELEIEGSLERIRAQAVAMKESSDLLDIVVTMRNEFIKLGHEAHYFWHMMWLPDKYEKAMTSGDGTKIGFVMELPRHIHGDISLLAKWEKSKKPTVVYPMDADAAIDYVDKMINLGDFKSIDPKAPSHDDIKHIGGLTFIMARTTHGEIGYSLPGVVKNPPAEDLDILVQFASAFDLAHRRFLDLQKAEKQAREAQIEAALERVRSRSMAMHNSEELLDVITVVSEQLQQLDFKFVHVSFANNDNSQVYKFWTAAKGFSKPMRFTTPYIDIAVFNNLREAQNKSLSFFTDIITKKEHNRWHKHLLNHGGSSVFTKEENEIIMSRGMARSIAINPNIMLILANYASIPYSDEENKIIARFGQVFEQSYTRFLDLKKAEAQSRESQIETALEKVRSRSLAMHKPNELQEVVATVAEKLRDLGVIFDAGGVILCTYFPDKKDVVHWIAVDDFSTSGRYLVPYFDNPIFNEAWDSKMRGDAYFSKEFTVEAKNDFFEYAFEHSDYKHFPEDYKQHVLKAEKHALSAAWSKNSALIIPTLTGVMPSESDAEIMKRFAKVFEQAYIRFMDLQKAEDQAREAKIEASLEKVRNVALSMTDSDNLLDIAKELYEQLLELGFNDIRNAIIDVNNEDDETFMDYDYSHTMGGTVTLMTYNDDPTLKEQLQVIANTTDGFSEMVLEGQQLQDLIEMRRKNGEADDPRLLNTTSVSYILYAFGNGAIGISNFGVLTENQKAILDRFRNVFMFAYKRYNDLAQTEAQAVALLTEKERLEKTLANLQATQKQLIQSEKMASLGELTAGIAHEIQNPLNFVNNFSEVSKELLEEMMEEFEKGDIDEARIIMADIVQNLVKINHHGKRADNIVKGMLQHSRATGNRKEPTNINALTDEYLRLAYHGLRAKDKSFNANLETDYDENIITVDVIPQDIGRVILNLFTNAFYAVDEKKSKSEAKDYKPTVSVKTKKIKDEITITVKDNGNGIPKAALDKIFQPFFTTKPTGKGTGLGLSMSYDIVKAHNGTLQVSTEKDAFTEFTLTLPILAHLETKL